MADENTTENTENPVTTPAGESNTDPTPGNSEGPTAIPYDRFREVNDERNALRDRLAALEAADEERKRTEAEANQRWEELYNAEKTAREQRESELAAERLNNLKARIGSELGLPAALATRLQGATEEELRADAKALRGTLPKPQAPDLDGERQKGNVELPQKPFSQWTYAEQMAVFERDPEAFRKAAGGR